MIFKGSTLKEFIPLFNPGKLMSDAAAAIFNGISQAYKEILPGKCHFHLKQSMRLRAYDNEILKEEFLNDITSLSKSHSNKHFNNSLSLFMGKYEGHVNETIRNATAHFKKYWLSSANIGWHSGVLPGTVTSNNGVECTNRVFKRGLQGMN